jgi:GT2 family glycosyltransferase
VSSRPAPVEIVIVHHNRPERCATTVEAFRSQPLDVTVTVVDNGSTPEARDVLRRALPDVDLIAVGHNAGFGPGANVGLRRWLDRGRGEWVVVAPDDAVPEPGCLARLMVAVEDRSDVGLASAEFGRDFDYVPTIDWVVGGYYRPAPRGLGFEEADYPHGTLLLARRGALADIGVFDERYFAYCEEVDLGLRARQHGWRVGIVWGAVVSNERTPDRVVADYLQLRNTLLLVRTWYGRYPAAVRWVYAAGQVLYRTARRGPAEFGRRRAEVRALTDFALGRFGPPPPLPSPPDGRTGPGRRSDCRTGPCDDEPGGGDDRRADGCEDASTRRTR